jgi:hypothetical protein
LRLAVVLLGFAGCEDADPIDPIDGVAADRLAPRTLPAVCRVVDQGSEAAYTWRIVMDAADAPLWGTRTSSEGDTHVVRWARRTEEPDRTRTRTHRTMGTLRATTFVPESVHVMRYQHGRPISRTEDGYEVASWRWDSDGRLVQELTLSSDYDMTGRTWSYWKDLLGRETLQYAGDAAPHGWSYTWDGARVVEEWSTSGSGSYSRIEWSEWDGDLPTRGQAWVKLYDWLDEAPAWTDEWTWEDGHPTSWTRIEVDGAVRTSEWTWDGDRLLTSADETWTWDSEGRPTSLQTDRELITWAWDGERLLERTWTYLPTGVWTSRTWGRTCPPASWAEFVERPQVDSPVPEVRPSIDPMPTEWW